MCDRGDGVRQAEGLRSRDFEFGQTCGLCPGSLPKEMNWSQDWADGGISLTKSNQSKSKQVQRGAGQRHMAGRTEDPCAAAVGIDRCPHLFHHFSFDVYQLGPLLAHNCPNIHDIVERRLPVLCRALPFLCRFSSGVHPPSAAPRQCNRPCARLPASAGWPRRRFGRLSLCHGPGPTVPSRPSG